MLRQHDDRKLRPIFDYLDNGSYKKALQEVDKLLKKNKDSQYLRAVKSLALIRLLKRKDAENLLSEVHNEIPNEDSVLQTMSMCYRDLQRNDLIVSIHENALKKDPTNEKLHIQLFMAYVRMRDYKKQQLTALNLYKIHSKNSYYFWAIMSIYLQAISAEDENMASKIILPLAEKMCEKFYKEEKFRQEAEYELYLMILEKQKKYAKMLEIMDFMRQKRIIKDHFNFFLHRETKLLRYEGRFEEAFNCLCKMIEANNDQYEYYIEAFEVAKALWQQDENESEPFLLIKLLDLINQMCSMEKTTVWKLNGQDDDDDDENSLYENISRRCPRGPFMAKVIILYMLAKESKLPSSKLNMDSAKVDKLISIDLLLHYFKKFGSKYVCIKDMIYMFQKIDLTDKQIEDLIVATRMSMLNLKRADLNKNLCWESIEYYHVKNFADFPTRLNEALDFFNLYQCAQKELKLDVDEKDLPAFNGFIYFIATSLMADLDIYEKNDTTISSIIFDMIVFLEHYSQINKSDFYAKLLLLCLYNAAGAALSSHAFYYSEEIKLIQNDTLGFRFVPHLLHCGLYEEAGQIIVQTAKYYTTNQKEASDYIIASYRNSAYSKIEEIERFSSKISDSLQYYWNLVERFFRKMPLLKNENEFNDFAEKIIVFIMFGDYDVDKKKLSDNRDLQLLRANHHKLDRYIDDVLGPKTFSQESLWLLFRSELIKSIVVAGHLSRVFLSANPNASTDDPDHHQYAYQCSEDERLSLNNFEKLVNNLNQLVEKCKSEIAEKLNYCLVGPAPCRISTYFSSKSWHLMLILLEQLLNIFLFEKNLSEENSKDFNLDQNLDESLFQELWEEINNLHDLKIQQSLKSYYKIFGQLSVWIEVLSIAIILSGLIDNNLKKLSKLIKRGKKKNVKHYKESEQFLQKSMANLSCFQTNLDKYLKFLADFLPTLYDKSSSTIPMIDKMQYTFPFRLKNAEETVELVRKKMSNSYLKSLQTMETVLKSKQKYLLQHTAAN